MTKNKPNIDAETIYVSKLLLEQDTFVKTYYEYILKFYNYLIEEVCISFDAKREIIRYRNGFEEKHRNRFV